MSNLKIQKIEAPKLNIADYGPNISKQFNNIDDNFQALANSDFFTGARGQGLKLIEVEPTSSNTFEFREDLEFHDESILEGDAGEDLKNSIINAFKKYNKSNTTWYVGKKYVLYIDNDKKVHNIYPIIYTSETVGVDGNTSQDNSYLDFEYVNKILTLTKSKGYPSLYYDADEKKYCWLINGAKTGIVAQGKDGLNGLPGPGVDFDVLEVETEPLTDDGFYKISRVYWPKYQIWQNFYLNISSEDGKLNAGGSGYPATDIEWLSGGRDEWINSYGSKTFLVSRTLIEYEEVEDGGTYIKNGDSYIPISNIYIKNNVGSYLKIPTTYIKKTDNIYEEVTNGLGDYIENEGSYELIKTIYVKNDKEYTSFPKKYTAGEAYVQKEIPVLHLCKLIHKSALNIKQGFDKVDVDPVKPDTGGIIVDDNKELIDPKTDTVVEETTTNNSEPVLMTAVITPNQTGPIIATDKIAIGSMAPVFSTVVSDKTKQEFTEAYDNNKKFVNEISTGKVTSIQYVSNGNKHVEVDLEGTLGSQIKASTAHYADDIYGVYLTKENMHSLTSTISSGSTTGVSLAFDDINWNTANNYALRCLYLKDCAYANGGGIPSSGILIYNSTRLDIDPSSTSGTTGTLNMRYVGNVGDYKKGDTTADPDKVDTDNVKSLILNLGTNGVLETGGVNVGNGKLSVKDEKGANSNLQTLVNIKGLTTIDGDLTVGTKGNPTKVSINGSTTISGNLDVGDGKLSIKDGKVNITGTTIDENLTVKKSTTTKDLTVENDLNVSNSTTTKDLTVENDLNVSNSTTTKDLTATNSIKSSSKTIQFVSYNANTNFAPAVGGPGNIANTSSEFEIADVVVNNNIIDAAVGDFVTQTTFDPQVNGGGDARYPLDIDSMQLVNVPEMLFNMINSLYKDQTLENIKRYNNTTWVGKDFELKIKYIDNYIDDSTNKSYHYYHITGYIECFNADSFNDSHDFDPDSAYLNKLNIDTLVRASVVVKNNKITHQDLSLKIYNNNVLNWGEEGVLALPYICVYPGSDYNDEKLTSCGYWGTPESSVYSTYNLAKGRVNMSSVNGPYLLDTYYSGPGDYAPHIYRDMHSVWITTTYYNPTTRS